MASNYALHMPGYPTMEAEGYKNILMMFRNAFPDLAVAPTIRWRRATWW